MTIQDVAKKHGFNPGDRVIVLTVEYKNGELSRHLYAFETAAEWAIDGLTRRGLKFTRILEPWDGCENCDFDNGD